MTPVARERITALWLSDFEAVRARVRKQVSNFDLAEDITMQAFAEVGEQLDRKDVREPAALLRTVADRRVVDYIRTESARPARLEFDESLESDNLGGVGLYRPHPDHSFAPSFDQAVRDLPEHERNVFILTDLRGLTVREAADVLGTSKSDVDRHAQSARNMIREELAA